MHFARDDAVSVTMSPVHSALSISGSIRSTVARMLEPFEIAGSGCEQRVHAFGPTQEGSKRAARSNLRCARDERLET